MATFTKVHNFTTNKTRIYMIVENPNTVQVDGSIMTIPAKTLCRVQFRDGDSALGITVCDSFQMTDGEVKAVRNALGLAEDGEFKKILSTYSETVLVEEPEEQEATEEETEASETEE